MDRRRTSCASLFAVIAALALAVPGVASAIGWAHSSSQSMLSGARSISCPSSSLCYVASDAGLVRSLAPARGAGSFSQPVDSSQAGGAGSSRPCAAGPTPCHFRSAPPSHDFFSAAAISCPTEQLCVAAGFGSGRHGEIAVSANPAAAVPTWSGTSFSGVRSFAGVSCEPNGVCVAVSDRGILWTTRHPTGGRSAWSPTDIYPYQPPSFGSNLLSCVSGLCVVASSTQASGGVVVSTDPAGGIAAWNGQDFGSYEYVGAVACASKRLCVAADAFGNAFVSVTPARTSRPWRQAAFAPPGPRFNGNFGEPPSAVACSPGGLCAINKAGVVYTSARPFSGRWGGTRVSRTDVALSCPSSHMCLAVDQNGGFAVGRR